MKQNQTVKAISATFWLPQSLSGISVQELSAALLVRTLCVALGSSGSSLLYILLYMILRDGFWEVGHTSVKMSYAYLAMDISKPITRMDWFPDGIVKITQSLLHFLRF